MRYLHGIRLGSMSLISEQIESLYAEKIIASSDRTLKLYRPVSGGTDLHYSSEGLSGTRGEDPGRGYSGRTA